MTYAAAMGTTRTSQSDPLRIDGIAADPAPGIIGLTICPGKHDSHAMSGAWARDLDADLKAIRDWGATTLVTLIEEHEFELLKVPDLPDRAATAGLRWYHLPIRDVSIPDKRFEARWPAVSSELRAVLEAGGRVAVHCRGGLGRSGTIAARLLVELGNSPNDAIDRVRAARPGAIETMGQERYVLTLGGQ